MLGKSEYVMKTLEIKENLKMLGTNMNMLEKPEDVGKQSKHVRKRSTWPLLGPCSLGRARSSAQGIR